MRITEFLSEDAVLARLSAKDKAGVLRELCEPICRRLKEVDPERLVRVLSEREKLGSTGIGDGVAIPHGKLAGLPSVVASFGISAEGVDFQAIDGQPTHLFFALIAPEDSAGVHLKALARISRLFKNPSFRRQIVEAPDARVIFDLISTEDAKA